MVGGTMMEKGKGEGGDASVGTSGISESAHSYEGGVGMELGDEAHQEGDGISNDRGRNPWTPEGANLDGFWSKVVESSYMFTGGVMLRLRGVMLWGKNADVVGMEEARMEIIKGMKWNVCLLEQEIEEDVDVELGEGVPKFWKKLDGDENLWTMGDASEDWVELDMLLLRLAVGCIRVEANPKWGVIWTGRGPVDTVLEVAKELQMEVLGFCEEVVKEKEVKLVTEPRVLTMSTGAAVAVRWMILFGIWEKYPDGGMDESLTGHFVRDVGKAARYLGDGVKVAVDEDELRARCGVGKVFFVAKGKDLGVFSTRTWKMALIRLVDEVGVGVDKMGNGKMFSRVDIGSGDKRKTAFRQLVTEEEAKVCMGMMEEGVEDVDNLIVGIRGFPRAEEFDEYMRRNVVKMFGKMGMKVFGLMALVCKDDGRPELVMFMVSMRKVGGSELRTAFGWKKGTAFNRGGLLIGGMSMEFFLHYDQISRGRDVRQDGPIIEIDGIGAMGMGMDEVTTLLGPYGDLGVVGMAKCVLNATTKAAKWKVFVNPKEWAKLGKLEGMLPNGRDVCLRVRLNAWGKTREGLPGKVEKQTWEKENCTVYCWDGAAISMRAAVSAAKEAGGGGGGRMSPMENEGAWVLSGGRKGVKAKQSGGVNLSGAFRDEGNEGQMDL
jgi:hypothetical protein